jgi:serine/threonine protein kinase
MGVVYRGRDAATGAVVAVKVMWSVGGLTDAAHVRARREAETLARIDDPGIVRVNRAGRCDGGPLEPEGVPYIVMEWIGGETLQQRLGGATFVTQAATVIRDLGRVLARVHALGIVHRGVKPANVFLIPGRKPGRGRRRSSSTSASPATSRPTAFRSAPVRSPGHRVTWRRSRPVPTGLSGRWAPPATCTGSGRHCFSSSSGGLPLPSLSTS